MSRTLRGLFLLTDVAFIVYWALTAFHLIPPEYAYQDYSNELLVVWNWSFFPLDVLISATGLSAVYMSFKNRSLWQPLALISLVLTSCSGLQAIAFWMIKQDYDLMWWIPNLYLLVYPMFHIPGLARRAFPANKLT